MILSRVVIAGTIGASFLVSFVSLSGLFALWVETERLKRIIPYPVALAVGVFAGRCLYPPDSRCSRAARLYFHRLFDGITGDVFILRAGKTGALAS
ncbi:hypothetical protein [Methyloprofundus sedimenti]|uniref:hypothetical protein n=1 Tax=Methyloprofundus sedimenti TaxID=1420851 RepID=UPI001E2D1518|nr:hypothetical protein [Methyloprofundus sedimenti]